MINPRKAPVPAVNCAILAVFLVSCGGCHEPSATGRNAAATIEFQEAASDPEFEHDFGLLRPRSVAEHEFQVRNRTAQPLTIERVDTDCACTVAQPACAVIAPGESCGLRVALRCPGEASDLSKRVRVHFKEKTTEPLSLIVRAQIRPRLDMLPNRLSLEVPSSEDVRTVVLSAYDRTLGECRPEFAFDEELISCEWKEIPANNDSHLARRWQLQIQPAAMVENRQPGSTIHTSLDVSFPTLPDGKVNSLPILIQARRAMSVMQSVVQFGVVAAGSMETRTVDVRLSESARTASLTAFFEEDDEPDRTGLWRAEISPQEKDGRVRVLIHLDATATGIRPGVHTAKLRIRLDSTDGTATANVPSERILVLGRVIE
ncbi:MAG: DUF1573 domain-containing protein [Planctomycetaceae bacterium]|nr:DUF1573 domain-containing protein [Planctomycetaceae bacterium]